MITKEKLKQQLGRNKWMVTLCVVSLLALFALVAIKPQPVKNLYQAYEFRQTEQRRMEMSLNMLDIETCLNNKMIWSNNYDQKKPLANFYEGYFPEFQKKMRGVE